MAHTLGNSDVNAVLTTWLNKNFIKDLEWTLQHQKFTTKAVIPEGAGNTGRFIVFAPPTRNASYSGLGTTAMTEATTTQHEFTSLVQTSINLNPAEFGEFTKVGKLWEYAAVKGARQKLLKRLKDGAAFSLDGFTRSKSITTTTSFFCSNDTAATALAGGSSSVPANMKACNTAALMSCRKILFDGLGSGFDDISGHAKGHYGAVLTPKQILDITTEVTTGRVYWSNAVVNVPGAMGQEKFVNGYIGSVYKVAVHETNSYVSTQLTGTSNDVGFVYADGGVGAMAFENMEPQIILNDVNSPYKNVNSYAWYSIYDAALIETGRVVKLYSLS